jgi:hypothetical protein
MTAIPAPGGQVVWGDFLVWLTCVHEDWLAKLPQSETSPQKNVRLLGL